MGLSFSLQIRVWEIVRKDRLLSIMDRIRFVDDVQFTRKTVLFTLKTVYFTPGPYTFTSGPYSFKDRLLYFSGPYTLLPTHIFINIFRQHKIDTLSPVTGPGSHTTLQFFNFSSDLYFDHATMNLLLSPFSELICTYT